MVQADLRNNPDLDDLDSLHWQKVAKHLEVDSVRPRDIRDLPMPAHAGLDVHPCAVQVQGVMVTLSQIQAHRVHGLAQQLQIVRGHMVEEGLAGSHMDIHEAEGKRQDWEVHNQDGPVVGDHRDHAEVGDDFRRAHRAAGVRLEQEHRVHDRTGLELAQMPEFAQRQE